MTALPVCASQMQVVWKFSFFRASEGKRVDTVRKATTRPRETIAAACEALYLGNPTPRVVASGECKRTLRLCRLQITVQGAEFSHFEAYQCSTVVQQQNSHMWFPVTLMSTSRNTNRKTLTVSVLHSCYGTETRRFCHITESVSIIPHVASAGIRA